MKWAMFFLEPLRCQNFVSHMIAYFTVLVLDSLSHLKELQILCFVQNYGGIYSAGGEFAYHCIDLIAADMFNNELNQEPLKLAKFNIT